jgi:type II secretory pathway predicted ATPase ExeA
MYETFYGLREKPFSLLPDPSFLYLGRPHSMAYAVLEYGVLSQAGVTVITGEVGSGKTTLIRHLLNQLDSHVTVGLMTNTGNVTGDLLRWILLAFRQDYKNKEAVELQEAFEDFLITGYAAGRRTVLLVDEAQNLTIETLEELRMLTNINADKDILLQIVLVGQPQLKEKLERPELLQFAQRIAASYHLGTLSEAETVAYIHHRLTHAGAAEPIFTPEACAAVHRYSSGVPRIINVLCDTALVYGYAEAVPAIGLEIVQSVIKDRSSGIQNSNAGTRNLVPGVSTGGGPGKATVFDRNMARELFATLRKR